MELIIDLSKGSQRLLCLLARHAVDAYDYEHTEFVSKKESPDNKESNLSSFSEAFIPWLTKMKLDPRNTYSISMYDLKGKEFKSDAKLYISLHELESYGLVKRIKPEHGHKSWGFSGQIITQNDTIYSYPVFAVTTDEKGRKRRLVSSRNIKRWNSIHAKECLKTLYIIDKLFGSKLLSEVKRKERIPFDTLNSTLESENIPTKELKELGKRFDKEYSISWKIKVSGRVIITPDGFSLASALMRKSQDEGWNGCYRELEIITS